jgi:DNA polymerase-3 subunit delta'
MPALLLSEILDQPEAVEFLTRVAASGRYANAYLLHGPAGVGKGSAAIAFARAMMCERGAGHTPKAQASLFEAAPTEAPAVFTGDACGECAACLKSRDLQHPDLKFLFPVSGEEKDLEETIVETIEAWREDRFFTFLYEKAASIRLSVTRELIRELAFKPFEADRRVVMVRDADRMREDQYSAMLKSIEEPGASTVWILTTSRPTRLPATIRSRCQRVRFRALGETTIQEFLRERVGLAEAESRMLAALSSGSLGRALQLRDIKPIEVRDQSLAMLELARSKQYAELWKAVQAINRFGKPGRESVRRMIEFQLLWQRDLLRARYDAPREQLVHRDREPEIRREAARVDATEIRRRLMILEESLRSMDGNIAVDATLFSTQSRIANPALSRTGWPRHPAARWEY